MTAISVLDSTGATKTISTIDELLAVLPASLGTKLITTSLPVTLASNEGLLTNLGAVNETAPASDTASSGNNGRLQRIAQRLTSLIALLPAAIGPTAKAGALSVTTATDDPFVALVGSLTETAPAGDTNSSGLNGRLQRIAQRITSLIALVPASLGSKAAASSFAVTMSTEDSALMGGLTETAPASDTASSGHNGRLQRIAQRLSSLIALVPASLGQKTSALSLAVVLPSDQVPTVGGTTKQIKTSPTTDTAAYASGDTLIATSAATLSRAADIGGILQSVTIIDKDDNKPAMYLVLLRANNALGTINAAPSITDANAEDVIAIIEVSAGDYKDLGGVSVAHIRGLSIPYQPATGTTTVYYGAVLTAGTPTFTATGIVINWGVMQD